MSNSKMLARYEDEDGNGRRNSTGNDVPVLTREIDPMTWKSKIYRWSMGRRGGAHRSLDAPPEQDSFWQNKTKPIKSRELNAFESATKEYWANSCFIYSALEYSLRDNHPALEYYLLLDQKNIEAGVRDKFDALKMIDEICNHFKDTSEMTKTKLALEFSSFNVQNGESIEVYATRFERLLQRLGLVNVVYDDAIVQSTFKSGLVGPEFLFVQTLLMMTNYTSFDNMKTAMISYSKSPAAQALRAQALALSAITTASDNQVTGEANLTEGGRRTTKRGKSNREYTGCFKCGSKNHRKIDCPQEEEEDSEGDHSDVDHRPRKKPKQGLQRDQQEKPKKKQRPPILSVFRTPKPRTGE